ncbi:MAG: hypothetical protein KDD41_03670 [Flavobacteriales bacterium]|nr:hypothetical protein [Flavobacteriales bacterium]
MKIDLTRKIIIVTLLCFAFQYIKAQKIDENGVLRMEKDTFVLKHNLHLAAKAQFYFQWGDEKYMELAPNKLIYQMKKGLEDGIYVATFDKELDWQIPIKDTAMVVTMKDGKLSGLLQRWDDEDKLIAEECEYKNGLMHGVRKLYYFNKEGKKLTNIEIYEKGLPVKTLQIEW